MAKIVLGQRPQKISRTIFFKLVDGSDGSITVDYKYRTRSEYGDMVDMLKDRGQKAAEEVAAAAVAADTELGFSAILDQTAQANVEFLIEALDGWNLDAAMNRDSIRQLVDEYPQGVLEIINSYRLACTEGRLGN